MAANPRDACPEVVQTIGGTCDCCGSFKEQTPEEEAYDGALERLIKCAKAAGKKRGTVLLDLRDWFDRVEFSEVASLDKDVVRLWWVRDHHIAPPKFER